MKQLCCDRLTLNVWVPQALPVHPGTCLSSGWVVDASDSDEAFDVKRASLPDVDVECEFLLDCLSYTTLMASRCLKFMLFGQWIHVKLWASAVAQSRKERRGERREWTVELQGRRAKHSNCQDTNLKRAMMGLKSTCAEGFEPMDRSGYVSQQFKRFTLLLSRFSLVSLHSFLSPTQTSIDSCLPSDQPAHWKNVLAHWKIASSSWVYIKFSTSSVGRGLTFDTRIHASCFNNKTCLCPECLAI